MSLSIIQGLKFRSLETPIHRIDPRVKLLLSIYILATAIAYGEAFRGILLVSLVLILIEVVLLRIGRVDRLMLATLRGAAPLAAIVLVLQLLSSLDRPPLEAAYLSAAYTSRFITFLASFSLFFLTTSPDEVGLTLTYLRVPYSYAFAFIAAIRFTPIIADEVQSIIDAQRSRGVEFEKGGFLGRVRRLIPIFMPLLVNAIRRSYEMAEAMEVKCFGASRRRTSYRELKATRRDYAWLGVSTALLVVAMYLRFSDLLVGVP